MITEAQYITYFQNLAAQHKLIQNGVGNKSAFFYIPSAYDLTEIDNALRNSLSSPCILLDSMKGRFDDAQSQSHVQYIDGQFMIIAKSVKGQAASIRTAMDTALQIGLDVLTRMQNDSRFRNMLTSDSSNRFTIHNVNYQQVGPMEVLYYGYAFTFTITCPFGFTVDNATWLDK